MSGEEGFFLFFFSRHFFDLILFPEVAQDAEVPANHAADADAAHVQAPRGLGAIGDSDRLHCHHSEHHADESASP